MRLTYKPSEPQLLATDHLLVNKEAALFMGCGLGKTAAVLDTLNSLFHDVACRGALVVAPLRVCNLTWPAEVDKWEQFSWMRVANLRTKEGWEMLKKGSAQIYVVNYEMLPQLRERFLKGKRSLPFDVVVWDELTKAKNHKSKRIRAVVPYLREKCSRHWGLTGTPTPNGLMDLFAQVRLLDGGARLGKSFTHFQNQYFFPTDYMRYNWEPRQGSREAIYKKLEGFALTLKSSDYLDIPDVVVEDIEVKIPQDIQEQVYDELERELFVALDDDEHLSAVNAAVLTNKLLQVCSGAVYKEDKNVHVLHSAKLQALSALYKKLHKRKEPLLVACTFKHEQDRIRAMFPEALFFQDAKTPTEQTHLVNLWNRGCVPMLVAHPGSIGHGLNLQAGGCNVVWFSPTWSSELYDQFNARLARRGQDKVTTLYRLLTTGTVEDGVVEALREKDTEQNALLDALRRWRKTKN